jgi:hypothetical protein
MELRKITSATLKASEGKLRPSWEGPYRVIDRLQAAGYVSPEKFGREEPTPPMEC